MADFNASLTEQERRAVKCGERGKCKLCGNTVTLKALPVWDDGGGDCKPIISRYVFCLQCLECETRTPTYRTFTEAEKACRFVEEYHNA